MAVSQFIGAIPSKGGSALAGSISQMDKEREGEYHREGEKDKDVN